MVLLGLPAWLQIFHFQIGNKHLKLEWKNDLIWFLVFLWSNNNINSSTRDEHEQILIYREKITAKVQVFVGLLQGPSKSTWVFRLCVCALVFKWFSARINYGFLRASKHSWELLQWQLLRCFPPPKNESKQLQFVRHGCPISRVPAVAASSLFFSPQSVTNSIKTPWSMWPLSNHRRLTTIKRRTWTWTRLLNSGPLGPRTPRISLKFNSCNEQKKFGTFFFDFNGTH